MKLSRLKPIGLGVLWLGLAGYAWYLSESYQITNPKTQIFFGWVAGILGVSFLIVCILGIQGVFNRKKKK